MPSILFQALIVQYTLKTLFQEVIPLGKHIWACPQNIIQGKSSVVSKFGGKIIATVIWNRYWMKQMLVAKLKKVWHFFKWNNLQWTKSSEVTTKNRLKTMDWMPVVVVFLYLQEIFQDQGSFWHLANLIPVDLRHH